MHTQYGRWFDLLKRKKPASFRRRSFPVKSFFKCYMINIRNCISPIPGQTHRFYPHYPRKPCHTTCNTGYRIGSSSSFALECKLHCAGSPVVGFSPRRMQFRCFYPYLHSTPWLKLCTDPSESPSQFHPACDASMPHSLFILLEPEPPDGLTL